MRTPEEIREYKRKWIAAWRAANPELALAAWRRSEERRDPVRRAISDAIRRAENPELVKEQSRRWYAANYAVARAKARRWKIENPERAKQQRQEFKAKHPHYMRDRRHNNEQARIYDLLLACLNGALRKRKRIGADWQRGAKIGQLVACTKAELIAHFERQFTTGMTWANYGIGGWEVDHIIPCNAFDLTDPAQQRACFHYTNLRPLWRADNLGRPKKED